MVGGGQLAYTILGIDYSADASACRYLILDPHYTGTRQQRDRKSGILMMKERTISQ